jgi:phosphatidylglycerophosphate synthase
MQSRAVTHFWAQLRPHLANMVTATGVLIGVAACASAAFHEVILGARLILVAVLIDLVDGPIARHCRCVSPAGADWDLLLDFVAFSVAPCFVLAGLLDEARAHMGPMEGRSCLVATAANCTLALIAGGYRLIRNRNRPVAQKNVSRNQRCSRLSHAARVTFCLVAVAVTWLVFAVWQMTPVTFFAAATVTLYFVKQQFQTPISWHAATSHMAHIGLPAPVFAVGVASAACATPANAIDLPETLLDVGVVFLILACLMLAQSWNARLIRQPAVFVLTTLGLLVMVLLPRVVWFEICLAGIALYVLHARPRGDEAGLADHLETRPHMGAETAR